jgi:hypothetical protein
VLSASADRAGLPVLGLAILATLVGLVASVLANRRAGARLVFEAITAGVLLGLLADVLLRLTAAAGVTVSLLLKVVPFASLRTPLAVAGPYAIQGLAAALLLVTFAVSIQAGRGEPALGRTTAPLRLALLTLGVGMYELVHGLIAGGRGGSLPAPDGADVLGGLALVQASRGVAIGGAVLATDVGLGRLLLTALVIGPLGLIGATAGKALSFEMVGALAVPLLALASVLLVLLLTRVLRRAAEPAARGPGQVGGFLVGMLATLAALRLASPV